MTMNRRQLLAATSTAGVTLSPLMNSVFAQIKDRAEGSRKHPLRFVFCIKSNGLWSEMIQPKGLEDRLPFKIAYDDKGRLENSNNGRIRKTLTPAADISLGENLQVSDVMKPLAPFSKRLSILQGINSGFNTYHMGCYQTLGGFQARTRNSTETLGPTIDSVLANAFPRPIPHVCLGHDPRSPSGVAYIPTSAAGRGKPIPYYTKPARAYKELFGVVGEGAAKHDYDMQSDILDFFAADAKRLQAAVAGPERAQLDRYLSAFESLRSSRKEIEAIGEQLRKFAPTVPQNIPADAVMKVGAGNAEIAIAALLSGLTNVVTLRFDLLGSTSYEGIGGLHGGVGHGQVKNILDARKRICGFQFEQIGRIAAALQSISEGDGTMLDNTLFVYTSDNGETHHSSGVNFPIVLLGNMAGRLRTQRYFAPGNEQTDRAKPGYTRLGDVWATLLAAAGLPFKEFGIPTNKVAHQPIQSLLS